MKLGQLYERFHPYLWAIFTAVALFFLKIKIEQQRVDAMLSASISVTAILMGFLGTAKAILLSYRSKTFDWLKGNATAWRLFIGYFRVGILTNFWVCLISLISLSIPIDNLPEKIIGYAIPAWGGIFVLAVCSFYRVLMVFFTLLSKKD